MTPRGRHDAWGDASLTALLVVQGLTTFVAIPLAAGHPAARYLFDAGHLVFAAVCVFVLTRHRAVQGALLASLLLLGAGPVLWNRIGAYLSGGPESPHEAIALVAFTFNALVTALVARRAFGPGRVTAHRVQGAVLVYLSVAALCAIAFDLLEAHAPGAIRPASGGLIASAPGARTAELSYFSLVTLTTVGYGDLMPVHPLARSLANLESVFGQLFPATFLARLMALHLAHATPTDARPPDDRDDA